MCIVVSMDGFHLPRSQLSGPDLIKRGQQHTFDAKRFITTIDELRSGDNVVYCPSFDHSIKDPIQNAIHVTLDQKIVIIEGLYIFMQDWCLQGLNPYWFNLRILVHSKLTTVQERLIKRHVSSGLCINEMEAELRCKMNDLLNARRVLNSVISLEDKNGPKLN